MPNASTQASATLRGLNRATLAFLSLVGRVRPDERRDVLAAFLALFAFMAGHALLETARDALFLATLPARRLPWVYLAIAVLALAIGHREPGVVRRLSARSELGRWLVVAGVVTGAFWFVVGRDTQWVLYALYVWSGVIASLVVVRFWTILAGRFTVTQAKRIFPVIASGSVLGAIVGSALARLVTAALEPRHLVLVAAAAFLAASAAPSLLEVHDVPARHRRQWSDLGNVGRTIWSQPYLRRIAVLVLLATVTFTLVDFVFKSTADRLVPAEDLGAFFASVYLTVNIVSLLVQALLVSALLRHLGLLSAVVFVPATLMVATLGFAVGGGLTLALVLKGADGSLRHSLYRTGTELLFVPLSDRLRAQVKGVIDVLGQRGGQALASVVILMLLSTPASETVFAALACVTAVGWLVAAAGIREPYLNLFRETLHRESARPASTFPALDMASLETLLATLNSGDDRRVIAAVDLLAAQGKSGAIPIPLLYHPSSPVVVRTLHVLSEAGGDDLIAVVPRLLAHADPEVRAAALRTLSVVAPARETFTAALADPDARVVGTARAALIACGWDEDGRLRIALTESSLSGDSTLQRAIAQALAARPAPELDGVLLHLLSEKDVSVVRTAVAAAGKLRAPGLVDPLVRLLGRRAVRDEVRAALAGYGSLAVTVLAEVLSSSRMPATTRGQIPGTIALTGAPQAPATLLRHLKDDQDGLVRFKILRALGRWRQEQPGFPLDGPLLHAALAHNVSTAFELMAWRHALLEAAGDEPRYDTELHRVLVALLRDKQDHALERAFRLLNLQSDSEEFQRVYRGLHSPLASSRAGSRELLEHMVVPPIREPLMVLVDDLHGEEPDAAVRPPGGRPATEGYAEVLAAIVAGPMESASSLAAVHAAELGLRGVEGAIAEAAPVSPEHGETLARAGQVLARAASR